jgi:hypothetical protein
MGGIIRFVPKSEFERTRLIREARAIYDSIFPPADAVGGQPDGRPIPGTQQGLPDPILFANARPRTNGLLQPSPNGQSFPIHSRNGCMPMKQLSITRRPCAALT